MRANPGRMTARRRTFVGLAIGLSIGLLGPSMIAVARWSGSGSRTISGRVVDQRGAPVAGICVEAHEAGSYSPEWELVTFHQPEAVSVTAADGTYALRKLLPLSYTVRFHVCPGPPQRIWGDRYVLLPGEASTRPLYRPEWWNDAPTAEFAEWITVTPNQDVAGIDAELTRLP